MQVEHAIDTLTKFLKKQQLADGSFLSYSSPDMHDFSHAQPYRTIFTTALILSSLQHYNDPISIPIKQKSAHYLLSQKSDNWTFNYWQKSVPEYTQLPYPDDLDDTCCALAALQHYDAKIISGEVLAKIVHILTELEIQEGGPYKTWITQRDVDPIWQDVDVAVNSNIAYFLSLQDIELPNITGLIEQVISRKKYESPYYPTPYPIIYFISRWYTGSKKKQLTKFLLDNRDKKKK